MDVKVVLVAEVVKVVLVAEVVNDPPVDVA